MKYETVVCREVRTVPVVVCVTAYDACGKPYTVKRTECRKVSVSVEKIVPVVRHVKVYCD